MKPSIRIVRTIAPVILVVLFSNVAQEADQLPSVGGAIQNFSSTITLNNATIANNQASETGGIRTLHGKSVTASNSIIANNTGASSANDCDGVVHSAGFNLILDTTGCTIKGETSSDITGKDPMLQSLALNPPGSTDTQALAAGSPALKAGNPAKPDGKAGHCMPTDQRGVTRVEGACDIGAFQLSS